MELDDGTFAAQMIDDVHFAVVVDPQLPKNDVVNGCRNLLESANSLAIFEFNMGMASGDNAEVFAAETRANLNWKRLLL